MPQEPSETHLLPGFSPHPMDEFHHLMLRFCLHINLHLALFSLSTAELSSHVKKPGPEFHHRQLLSSGRDSALFSETHIEIPGKGERDRRKSG